MTATPLTWSLNTFRSYPLIRFSGTFLGIMLFLAPIVNWENAYRARYYLGMAPKAKKV